MNKYTSQLQSYAGAYGAVVEAGKTLHRQETAVTESDREKVALLAQVEENPDLAADSALTTKLTGLVASEEVGKAAVRGLRAKLASLETNRTAAGSALKSLLHGDLEQAIIRRRTSRMNELSDLLESWAGPRPNRVIATSPIAVEGACQYCARGRDLQRLLTAETPSPAALDDVADWILDEEQRVPAVEGESLSVELESTEPQTELAA